MLSTATPVSNLVFPLLAQFASLFSLRKELVNLVKSSYTYFTNIWGKYWTETLNKPYLNVSASRQIKFMWFRAKWENKKNAVNIFIQLYGSSLKNCPYFKNNSFSYLRD